MSAEVSTVHDATGATVRGALRKLVTTGGKIRMIVVSTGAEEDRTVANWANYLITLTETPASSYAYVGDMPANVAAGWYALDIYSGTAISSTLIETQVGYWTGSAWVLGAADVRLIDGTADKSTQLAAAIGTGVVLSDPPPPIGAAPAISQVYLVGSSTALDGTYNIALRAAFNDYIVLFNAAGTASVHYSTTYQAWVAAATDGGDPVDDPTDYFVNNAGPYPADGVWAGRGAHAGKTARVTATGVLALLNRILRVVGP